MESSDPPHDEHSPERPINARVNNDRRVQNKKTKHNRRVTDTEWSRWTSRIRDVFFLGLGLMGTANQLFFANPPNPVLYPLLAGLLGAPFALALDQRRRESATDEDE